jgi:NAD(P)-dependent dehydrogenase (short-subunit alcohol dehydrogenase family)
MKSVLVTGASSGIGRACVERLAGEGWRVFAGVRSDSDGARSAASSDQITSLQLDVTDSASISAALEQLAYQAGGRLEALVNNAGIGVGGALETVPLDQLRRIFETNVVGQVAVSQAFLPLLRLSHGRIVFIGSAGGRIAFPYAGPYHGSKFAIEGLAESLRAEVRSQKVSVSILEPGPIATPIWGKAARQVAALRASLGSEADLLYGKSLESFEQRLRSAEESGDPPENVAEKLSKVLGARSPSSRYQVGRGVGTLLAIRPLLSDFAFDLITKRFLGRS